ncbi:putative membrane protein [Cryobacterium sp. MP_M5]|uniref:TMEM175 family protein n=1 Tax=unclassified Cryobacterium TaxID=2649013 RepID=UPI0018CAD748|nr:MULTISPECIES: TMEM175 family protein [unclassified Cryobacterium]MBG6056675.1 putative membrane protein [Cryobacterium sp. MP_M3]MEC5176347.1 putative membrane protein [Cryobacterium sp. MP_M5]
MSADQSVPAPPRRVRPPGVADRYRALLAAGSGTERVEFFSDAVFAIAMTLLVLDIRVPDVPDGGLGEALVDLTPKFFAYALSFAVIGINWASHHRKFRVITGFTRRLVQINLLLLLLVAFVPFPTAVLSEYGEVTEAVVLYAATVAAISAVQAWLWVAARRAGLLHPAVDRGVYRYLLRNSLVSAVVLAASIVIALLGQPLAAMYSWILIWPLSFLAHRAGGRRPADLEPAGD